MKELPSYKIRVLYDQSNHRDESFVVAVAAVSVVVVVVVVSVGVDDTGCVHNLGHVLP